MEPSSLGLIVAFAAGVVSFVSPCVLPLVPAYISYVAQPAHGPGLPTGGRRRRTAVIMSMFFVLGFGGVFVTLGASATAIGRLFLFYRAEANVVGGIVVIVFGLFMLGAMRHVTWIHRDLRLHPRLAGGHPANALLLGIAFGFGWTPCIGPVLGAILTVGAVQGSLEASIGLLTAYALGLGLPFILSAVFLRELLERIKVLRRIGRPLEIVAGAVMVLVGMAMVTNKLTEISIWLLQMFPALARVG